MAKYPLALIPEVTVEDDQAQLPPPGGMVMDPEYGSVQQALSAWREQGAHWVHLEDANLTDHIRQISALHSVHLQLAGGIGDQHTLEAALATGASRVVIDPTDVSWAIDAIGAHGDRLAAALDVRAHGATAIQSSLNDAGCARYVVTDNVPHGHWRHGDRHLLQEFLESTDRPVVAKGGIAHLEDLHQLHELVPLGLEGIVLGDALYKGAFSLAEAMAASADRFDLFFWGPPQP